AQIYPSFRPSMPMINPIGPRDPAMHTQPGNLSNIPMGGTTATGTTSDQTGRRTIKKVKQAVTRGPLTNSKITSQSITSGSGARGTGGSSSSTGGSGTGGSGVPPVRETRLPQNEVLVEIRRNPTSQTRYALLRRNRLELLDRLALRLTNSTILRLRIPNGRSVAATIRALGARSQPNYQYALADDQTNATAQKAVAPNASDTKAVVGDPAQYALAKLRLREAQGLARGEKVPVAIIDSGIDVKHPDLNGAITAQFDALGSGEPPHAHGTAVAGIVAAHGRLLGAAPSVNLLA